MGARNVRIDRMNEEAYVVRHTLPGEAGRLAQRAFDRSVEEGYVYGQALAMRTMAAVAYHNADAEGVSLALEALNMLEQIGDRNAVGQCHNVLACFYFAWAQYDLMLEHLRVAFSIAQEMGDRRMEALTLNNMAVASDKIGDYDEAVRLYENCRVIWSEIKDESWYWTSTSNMGHALRLAGKYDEGIGYLEEAFRFLAPIRTRASAECAMHLAGAYNTVGRFEDAEAHINYTVGLCEEGTFGYGLATLHYGAGELAFAKGDYEDAVAKLRQARQLLSETEGQDGLRETLRLLATSLFKLNRWEEAYEALNEYVLQRETVFTQQAEARTRTLQVIHRVEWTQKEAELVRQQNEELQLLNKKLVATIAEKDALHAELLRHAVTDELTGVANRRRVIEFGRREFERHRRLDAPLTIIMLDVDHFKTVNDSFGHAAGDEVLKAVAFACNEQVRAIDAFGRWGGEEFCVILPGAKLETAIRIAERIRETVSALRFSEAMGNFGVTVSLGVAEVMPEHRSLDDLLFDADRALYTAKASGRDRVASPPIDNDSAAVAA